MEIQLVSSFPVYGEGGWVGVKPIQTEGGTSGLPHPGFAR